jgi:hypothetical protein
MTARFAPLTIPYALPPAAPISQALCAALLSALGIDGGDITERIEIDVTPLPLATLSRLVGYDAAVIAVLEEAQFVGRGVALRPGEAGYFQIDLADRPVRSSP